MQCIEFMRTEEEEQHYPHRIHSIHGPPQPEALVTQHSYDGVSSGDCHLGMLQKLFIKKQLY